MGQTTSSCLVGVVNHLHQFMVITVHLPAFQEYSTVTPMNGLTLNFSMTNGVSMEVKVSI